MTLEVGRGGVQHGGLAGPGRPDDQHQPVMSRDSGGGFGLHHVETNRGDGGGWCWRVELSVDRPGDDVFFLGEDVIAGVVAGGRFDPHRTSIGSAASGVGVGRVEINTPLQHRVRGAFECGRPACTVDAGLWSDGVTQGVGDVEAMPRRSAFGEFADHIIDRHALLVGGLRACSGADARLQGVRGDPDRGGLTRPQCSEVGGCGAGLVAAGVLGCLSTDRTAFFRCRITTLPDPELGQLALHCRIDLGGTFGELLQDFSWDADNFGLAFVDLTPRDTETGGDFGA